MSFSLKQGPLVRASTVRNRFAATEGEVETKLTVVVANKLKRILRRSQTSFN